MGLSSLWLSETVEFNVGVVYLLPDSNISGLKTKYKSITNLNITYTYFIIATINFVAPLPLILSPNQICGLLKKFLQYFLFPKSMDYNPTFIHLVNLLNPYDLPAGMNICIIQLY